MTKLYSRRNLLAKLNRLAQATGLMGAVMPSGRLLMSSAAGTLCAPLAYGKTRSGPPQRLIVIFLKGAWNSIFSIDPVVNDKKKSSAYDPAFANLETAFVPGKKALAIGPGFLGAMSGFAAVPTCFINGIAMDITAHDIASEIMLAGVSSSVRTDRPFAGIGALLGTGVASFPSHVMLGIQIPTKGAAPGISADNIEHLSSLLRSPSQDIPDASWIESKNLLATLDTLHRQTLQGKAGDFSDIWNSTRRGVLDESLKLAGSITLTDDIKNRYKIGKGDNSFAEQFAGAYLCLAGDLTDYVSIGMGYFDSHSNELTTQYPKQKMVANALGQLLLDLSMTPDPASPEQMLIDTTNVYLTSEFTRTPKFNASSGTDHMPTASAILCGRGVIDNSIVGATSDKGMPLGWADGRVQTSASAPRLLPQDLAATILRHFGRANAAQLISQETVDGIFYA